MFSLFFFYNDPATTEIYTLSLHDALPISHRGWPPGPARAQSEDDLAAGRQEMKPVRTGYISNGVGDRKSTRLNSSHSQISYAVFCLKKKKNKEEDAKVL